MPLNLDISKEHVALPIKTVLEAKFLKNIVDIKDLGGGSFGRAYLAAFEGGEKVVAKAYRVRGMNKTEGYALKLLSENTNVKMPDVLSIYDDDALCLTVMEFMEGKNALNPNALLYSKKMRQTFADDVTLGMLSWHKVTGEKYGYLENPVFDSWKDFYLSILNDTIEKAHPLIGKKGLKKEWVQSVETARDNLDYILGDTVSPPTLIHGDLNVMNIMVNPKNCKLNGFIDPFNSMWADRDYDLFQLKNIFGNHFYLFDTYKEKANIKNDIDLKIALYGSLNETLCFVKAKVMFRPLHYKWDYMLRSEHKKHKLI